MAIAYKSAGAGFATETTNATLNLPCPATVAANDILIAHVVVWGTTYSPTTPSGWTLLFGPYGLGTGTPTARAWAYGKIAAGNEDGANVNFGAIAATTGRMGRIYSFSGYVSGAIGDVVPSASYAGNSSETDPVIQSVTTTVVGAKAIALISQDDNNSHSGLGAVTGGTWAEAVSDYVSSSVGPAGGCLQLQVGTPTSDPGTIAGGTVAGNDDEANTICFEIRPNVPNTPPTVALGTPADGATIADTTPDLTFTGTDPEDDDVSYEVQIATDNQFTEEGSVTKSDYYTDGTNARKVGYTIGSDVETGVGQSFIAIDGFIDSCKFGLSEGAGSPTGNAYAKIYEYSGTWGTDAIPTGDPVAVSDAFDVTTISGASQTLYTFTFSGENRAFLTGGKGYIVAFEYSNGDSSNYLHIYVRGFSLTDPGNASWKDDINSWKPYDYNDLNYEVYQTQNDPVAVDTYNAIPNTNFQLYSGSSYTSSGQSFTCNVSRVLSSASFKIYKTGSPPDNVYVEIYAHTGTYGSSSIKTGDPIATSDPISASSLGTVTDVWVKFNFSTTNKITLQAGTYYVAVVVYESGDASNKIHVGHYWNSTTAHDGNQVYNLTSYSADNDVPFIINADSSVSMVLKKLSDADAGFSGDPDSTDPFASAQAVTYTVQSALDPDTYYWRVRGKDPSGTNTWGAWSPGDSTLGYNSFTIETSMGAESVSVSTVPTVVVSTPTISKSETIDVTDANPTVVQVITPLSINKSESISATDRILNGDPSICDSYSESNLNGQWNNVGFVGQSFTGDGGVLDKTVGCFVNGSSATGTICSKIYSHTGTYGSSSQQYSLLATSDDVDVATIGSSFELVEFTFSGDQKITLTNSEHYVVIFQRSGTGVHAAIDSSSPTHDGNMISSNYVYQANYDLCFYVYTISSIPSSVLDVSDPQIIKSESITVTDSPTSLEEWTSDISVEKSESVTVSISPTVEVPVIPLEVNESETITVTELVTLIQSDLQINKSDSITLTEARTVTLPDALTINKSDTIDVTDIPYWTVPEIGATEVNKSDTVTVTDSPTVRFTDKEINAPQSVFIITVPTVQTSDPQIIKSESITVTDAPPFAPYVDNPSPNKSDNINVTTSATVVTSGLFINKSELVLVGETLNNMTDWTSDLSVSKSDSVTVTDDPTVEISDVPTLEIFKADTITVTTSDPLFAFNDYEIVGIENVTITESIGIEAIEENLFLDTNEFIYTLESIDFIVPVNLTADDTIVVTDIVETENVYSIESVQLITVTTNPLFRFGKGRKRVISNVGKNSPTFKVNPNKPRMEVRRYK